MSKFASLRKFQKPTPALVFNSIVSFGLLLLLCLDVRGRSITRAEEIIFHAINNVPDTFRPLFVTVMQLGSYPFVFVAALAALIANKRRLAGDLLLAGNLAYWLALACKILVGRRRPAELFAHVLLRDHLTGILGFPSGHVAVATAIGITLARYLPKHYRYLGWLALASIAFARIYVGAHLPIDVVGGFLVGWLAVCLTQLILGVRNVVKSPAHVRAVLASKGIKVQDLRPIQGDFRGSAPYRATTTDGSVLFVKATGTEQRDADWLYKLYRRAFYRNIEDEAPFITAKQKNEHEAYIALRAALGGVRTARPVMNTTDDEGNAFLVQHFVAGDTLETLPPRTLDNTALLDIWQQVARLHETHIAHRDLRGANILLQNNEAHLVDLGFAEEDPSRTQRAQDIVALLVTTTPLSSATASVMTAKNTVGCEALSASLPYLQKDTLPRAMHAKLKEQPHLLNALASEITKICGTGPVKLARIARINRGNILLLLSLGLGVYLLLPQAGEVGKALKALSHANPAWLAASLLASAATYLVSAFMFQAGVQHPLPLKTTTAVQLASSFANRLAPGSIGHTALGVRFLQKRGLPLVEATTSLGIMRLGAIVSSAVLLPVLLLFARNVHPHIAKPKGIIILAVVVAVLLATGIVLAIPKLKHGIVSVAAQTIRTLRSFIASGKAPLLIVLSLIVTFSYGACLYFALLAIGASPAVQHVLLVYMAGSSISAVAPTPGGLGATEAALVSGLTLFGVPTEQAIAGTLIYRIMSFWLPILPGFVAFRYLTKKDAL